LFFKKKHRSGKNTHKERGKSHESRQAEENILTINISYFCVT
jgi:hypothetical protein